MLLDLWTISPRFFVGCGVLSLFSGVLLFFNSVNTAKITGKSLVQTSSQLWVFLKSYRFCFSGPRLIQDAYTKADGKPFAVQTPGCKLVFITSKQHLKDLDSATFEQLSLHAAAKQMFKPQYTMHGFNWHDMRGVEGVGFVRTLRVLLTQHIPSAIPALRDLIEREFSKGCQKYGQAGPGLIRKVRVYPLMKHVIAMCNGYMFFGKDLVEDPQFMTAAVDYIEQVISAAEMIRLSPPWLAHWVGRYYQTAYKCHEKIFTTLITVVIQRLEAMQRNDFTKDRPNDCIQWIIDTAPKEASQISWTPERIVQEIMAIWFGSVHASSMTLSFAMFDLCLYPEYVVPIRNELHESDPDSVHEPSSLPLLDSFFKESLRMNPAEAVSTRRMALKTFNFHDGTRLNRGDWACVPLRAMLREENLYPSADQFNGFRFVQCSQLPRDNANFENHVLQPEPTKFTDATQWQIWGSGRKLWYVAAYSSLLEVDEELADFKSAGRFWVSVVFKLIMEHTLTNYDLTLVDPQVERSKIWRTTIFPNDKAMVNLEPVLTPEFLSFASSFVAPACFVVNSNHHKDCLEEDHSGKLVRGWSRFSTMN